MSGARATSATGKVNIDPEIPHGIRPWIVVASTFVCQMLCAGLVQGIGVTFVELQEYFDVGSTEIGWVGSTLGFSALSVGVFSGALSRRFGCRPIVMLGGVIAGISLSIASLSTKLWHLYICIGLTGIGCGMVLVPAVCVVGFNFKKGYSVANGFQYTGVGVGIMIIPPLFQILFERYGWHGALLIVGSLLFNVIVCGLLMLPSKLELNNIQRRRKESPVPVLTSLMKTSNTQEPPGTVTGDDIQVCKTLPNRTSGFKLFQLRIFNRIKQFVHFFGLHIMWENPEFNFFVLAIMMFGFGYASFLNFFIPRAIQDMHIARIDAALLMSILGAFSILARVTHGIFIEFKLITPMKFFCISNFVMALSSFCTPFTSSYFTVALCAASLGLSSGVVNPLMAVVSRHIVGQEIMSAALGITWLFNGIGVVIGVFVTGYVHDLTGNYDFSFYIAGFVLLLVVFIISTGYVFTEKHRKKKLAAAKEEQNENVFDAVCQTFFPPNADDVIAEIESVV